MTTTIDEINSKIKQYDEQIAQLKKHAEELRNQERAGVIEEIRRKISEYGISATDLKLSGRGGKRSASSAVAKAAAKAKYRSPTGETWSGGRGRKPRWVAEALAAGKSMEEFEVK